MTEVKDLISTFIANSTKYPNEIALLYKDKTYTYKELNHASDLFCDRLLDHGVGPNSIIPIVMDRSPEFIIAVFAILKAGGAYLPVSIDFPESRILYLINQGTENLFLVRDPFFILSTCKKSLIVSKDLFKIPDGTNNKTTNRKNTNDRDPAYVIFTSGSTGMPKGVVISRKSLNQRIAAIEEEVPFTKGQRYLFSTNSIFDVSVSEIFGWINGLGALVIIPENGKHKVFQSIFSNIIEKKVTHASFSPSILNQLILSTDKNILKGANQILKNILVAGEAFKTELANLLISIFPKVNIFNMYGPTEATVYATFYKINNEKPLNGATVPIGIPLKGVKLKVTKDLELLIGGAGLFDRYLGQDILTQEKLSKIENELYYQTGDLVRIIENQYVYEGRIDHQIKINGIRIEPGEIENAIVKIGYPDCYIAYLEDTLVAFIAGEIPQIDLLKVKLNELLPAFMIPQKFLFIQNSLPLNPSGKTDRKKLIEMFVSQNFNSNFKKSANSIPTIDEKDLQIVIDIINKTGKGKLFVSSDDNLHMIGLDSLSIVSIMVDIEKEFKIDLPDNFINEYKTPKDITKGINKLIKSEKVKNDINGSILIPDQELILFSKKIKDDLVLQFNIIESHFRDQKPIDSFSASNFQKSYINFGFDLVNETSIKVVDRTFDELLVALKSTLNYCEVFRTSFFKDNNELMASYYRSIPEINFPLIDLSQISKLSIRKITSNISNFVKIHFNTKNPIGAFYGVYIVSLGSNNWEVKVILHHVHCDGASSGILQRIFFGFLSGEKQIQPPRLKDYLGLIRENNKKFDYKLEPITNQLIKAHETIPQEISEYLFGEKIHIIKLKEKLPATFNILYSAALVTSKAAEVLNVDSVAFQCLFDFRKIGNLDFSQLVGDCHLSMSFVRNRSDDNLNFMNKALYHFKDLHQSRGISINELVFGSIPLISNDQQAILDIFERCLFKINFIGEKSTDEANEIIASLTNIKTELKKARSQVRFQCFSVKNELYLCQL